MKSLTLRAPEVRAALDTGVVEIVRAVKLTEFGPSDTPGYDWHFRDPSGNWHDIRQSDIPHHCPYGNPGERRWVRETWALRNCHHVSSIQTPAWYKADGDFRDRGPWRSPITMPEEWSRLTVEITDVQVIRVQDVSEQEAKRAGYYGNCGIGYIPAYLEGPHGYHFAREWDERAKAGERWEDNPWVWAITARRVNT
jgi:hypothetical protein